LNLGCGTLPLPGWINIDLAGLPVDVSWNLLSPLPFPDDSVDAVFHEHVIEHVPGVDAYNMLKECRRVLRPGGVLRIVCPDATIFMASYFDPEHAFINDFRPGRPTPMLALQEEFYGFGHKAIYDYETMALYCETIGFSKIDRKAFGESLIEPCPDSEWRIANSFYCEAIK
jgi:predicted SAM-dependent methyltransferase